MSLFRSLFGAYVRRRIGRGLDGLHVSGLGRARDLLAQRPAVLAATHVAWWDGMLLFPLDDALGRSCRVWMDASNLEKLPFFAPLGALPLDARSPTALRRSFRTAASWLDRPERALWVFPQGLQRPSHLRPLGIKPGASLLARQAGALLLPVALSYGFREAPVPSAVVSFGEPVDPHSGDALEASLCRELERADRFFSGEPEGFETLVAGRARGTEHGLGARMLRLAAGGARG